MNTIGTIARWAEQERFLAFACTQSVSIGHLRNQGEDLLPPRPEDRRSGRNPDVFDSRAVMRKQATIP